MSKAKPPLAQPCGSCPYRKDVPGGVWHAEEYSKLPHYDLPTGDQPPMMFDCHQADGHLCAGWVGCHDMQETLSVRIALFDGSLTEEEFDQVLDYKTDVDLWPSGADAARHGLLGIIADEPDPRTETIKRNLKRKRGIYE